MFLTLVAWPAVSPTEIDGVPLSDYTMFARPRSHVTRLHTVVQVDDDGTEHRLDARAIGGTDQPMQAVMTVRQAIRDGRADRLCREIAATLAPTGAVEIVTLELDAVAWFAGDRTPDQRVVHARCTAGRVP